MPSGGEDGTRYDQLSGNGGIRFTGMTFDWSSFENVKIGEKSVRCSACGDEHTWKRPDAYLEDDGGGG